MLICNKLVLLLGLNLIRVDQFKFNLVYLHLMDQAQKFRLGKINFFFYSFPFRKMHCKHEKF